ncbi:MAG TPA: VOC family protein [Gammaproteobacteria bacterium]|jgi:PhnB protein|nr:VOC family protein [Gammaproteobacteria bacterium]
MTVKAIPEGYHTVTPYLTVEGAAKLIDFLKQAFEAKEILCMTRPDGIIGHAEVRIGDSIVMLSEACGEWKPMPAMLHLYVEDVDVVYRHALQAGATSLREPIDQFYGDRSGGVRDLCGNHWWIATHKENLPPEELAKRAEAFWKQQSRG